MRPKAAARARTDEFDGGDPAAHPPMAIVPPPGAAANADAMTDTPRALRFLNGPLTGILFANAITFAGVTFQHWPFGPVLMVYLGQSVAIGLANVIRILGLRRFTTDGLRMNGSPVPVTRQAQRRIAGFFAFHYGSFHLAYALFLLGRQHEDLPVWTSLSIAANVALFAGPNVLHAVRDHGREFRGTPNLGTLMFYPYLRVLPMHLAIILGTTFPQGALPFFIGLKTAADVGMHEVERRLFWRPSE